MSEQTSLAIMERAATMLAEAGTIQKVREFKNLALVASDWARRQKLGKKVIGQAQSYALEAERKLGTMLKATPRAKGGQPHQKRAKSTCTPAAQVEPTLAEIGVSRKEAAAARAVATLPTKEFEELRLTVEAGEMSAHEAAKKAQKKAKKKKRAAAKTSIPDDLPAATERYRVFQANIQQDVDMPDDDSLDFIITDPPYPKKYLPLYGDLGAFAARTLKPGGSLVCMVGQSYLPDVLAGLSNHMHYQWTLAYLTPGGQAVQLWDRKVNTFWKPLLWFVKGKYEGEWIGDVCRSAVNDNDKDHHHWGQSESGMADIIERFTLPGQIICDPFCGGGTTGVVAVQMKRLFVGFDIDAEAIKTTIIRLAEIHDD